ncbi:hypothetical protein ACTI_85340 [Actinoplanes sp. OR16]|uniref:hypothetical protein n=1 Tax=Actinoplanes sp. OR16 TaxID=946334 RepID=UPI000F705E8A|nr:hypothetical protein [Actinoplanes sp. OR16]BBH71849.1 hypothetical protein ACTI_85340 [Actinoplanes sp. OR16]
MRLRLALGGVAAVLLMSLGIVIGTAIASPEGAAEAEVDKPYAGKNNSTPFTLPPTTRPAVEATTPEPEPTTEPVATTTKAPSYKKLTARAWKKIAKSPEDYIGDHYVVYGVVTQFDAATGEATFRANVDGVRHSESYEYDTNTILDGYISDLADLVEDDEFRAKVTVSGSYSYDTQIGGNTTAPQLSVDAIEVL